MLLFDIRLIPTTALSPWVHMRSRLMTIFMTILLRRTPNPIMLFVLLASLYRNSVHIRQNLIEALI